MERIERSTSPLPRECSTTELHGRGRASLPARLLLRPSFLRPAQLRATDASIPGAGEGNRTLVVSLEGFCSTIELHPRVQAAEVR